jgi:lipoate-protein ligase A
LNWLDHTFPTPEENLACDEALLDGCDERDGPEVLRFWESQEHFVVVGYSNRVEREVDVEACRELDIPILRRCSGGGAVLQGPGCLNYSLILRLDSHPALQTVTGTNRFIMERNRAALESLAPHFAPGASHLALSVRGHTDLAVEGRKLSGNAQRRKRHAVLFHGTFLLNADLDLVTRLLPMPSKQPDYRQGRSHKDFLENIAVDDESLHTALRSAWNGTVLLTELPHSEIQRLTTEKYAARAWNWKF